MTNLQPTITEWEKPEAFPLRSVTRQSLHSPLLVNMVLQVLEQFVQDKEIKDIQSGKEEVIIPVCS